jgi:hypothetical protein
MCPTGQAAVEVVFGWCLLGVIGPAYRALFLGSHTRSHGGQGAVENQGTA